MRNRPDRLFLVAAALNLVAGAGLGVWMGLAQDFALRPVHAHVNLMGWASLALFGLVYRAYPEFGATRLAWVHFVVAAAASICFPIGLTRLSRGEDGGLIGLLGIALWIASALIFAFTVTRLAFANAER